MMNAINVDDLGYDELRYIALGVLNANTSQMIQIATTKDLDKVRAFYKAQAKLPWWGFQMAAFHRYAKLKAISEGMVFRNISMGGKPTHTMDMIVDFSVDYKHKLLESDQGRIIVVHGTPDGRIIIGRETNGAPIIRPVEFLAELVPPGTYFLASCYNGKKSEASLKKLRDTGRNIILAGTNKSISVMPISPIDYSMPVYSLTKEDIEYVYGPGSYDE